MVTSLLLVLAQMTPPAAGDDIVVWMSSSVKWMIDQFQNRNFLPLCGVVIMVLVRIIHKLFDQKLERKKLALVASLLGVISAVGMNLISLAVGSTKTDIIAAISNGIMVGAAASGFWNVLGKTASAKVDMAAGKAKRKFTKKKLKAVDSPAPDVTVDPNKP